MIVSAVDWCCGLGADVMVVRCVLTSVSSSDLSSTTLSGEEALALVRLFAAAAWRLARVGTWVRFPEFDFLTWMGRAVTLRATMGELRIPLGVGIWACGMGGAVGSSGVPESDGVLLPDLATLTTAALPRRAC
jgi:hypothetical protein